MTIAGPHLSSEGHPLHGVMAEYATPGDLVAAAKAVRTAGWRKVDAYTPFPIEALNDVLDLHHSKVPLVVLGGGIVGLVAGYGMQYWMSVVDYPLNIGGRPFHSWVAFIPPTFETTVLFAGIAAVVGMIVLNGLPRPYHAVFNNPRFSAASRDRYFLVLTADDPMFDAARATTALRGTNALDVTEVEE
ncbi:MAG: DUF3341 domain-containing protein [Thermoanaerobaculia bacterium]